jgi:hypothetical protein
MDYHQHNDGCNCSPGFLQIAQKLLDPSSVLYCAVCIEGTGLNANGSCSPCTSGTWNDGTFATCQDCPTTSFAFDGKEDLLTGGTVSPLSSVAKDLCMPLFSELTIEQGTLIADRPMLSDQGRVNSIDDCAAKCGVNCQFFTYGYLDDVRGNSTGVCFLRELNNSGNATTNKKLFYRVGVNRGYNAQAFGWYMRWEASSSDELTPGPDAVYPAVSMLDECLRECDFSANCALVYYKYNSSNACVLQPGRPVPLYRTAIRSHSQQILQAQAEDGMACFSDHDCYSGYCRESICGSATCFNGAKDVDEDAVDCGGAHCGACSKYEVVYLLYAVLLKTTNRAISLLHTHFSQNYNTLGLTNHLVCIYFLVGARDTIIHTVWSPGFQTECKRKLSFRWEVC